MLERRKFKRVSLEKADTEYYLADFNFWAEARAKGSALLRDVSLGGVSFKSDEALPNDALLSMELHFQSSEIADLCGRVVHSTKINNNGYHIGVNFSWWGKDKDKKVMVELLGDN